MTSNLNDWEPHQIMPVPNAHNSFQWTGQKLSVLNILLPFNLFRSAVSTATQRPAP
jgi:hypothetical protein